MLETGGQAMIPEDTMNTAATTRLERESSATATDEPVPVTSDGYRTTLDVYGRDVVDTGMTSDADLGGMGADLDAMPGDETPIAPLGAEAGR
jgi:hypothetical protein